MALTSDVTTINTDLTIRSSQFMNILKQYIVCISKGEQNNVQYAAHERDYYRDNDYMIGILNHNTPLLQVDG